MEKDAKTVFNYRKQHLVLFVVGKILLNLIITGLVLAFGFWLLLASNIGPAYLPNIMEGALDMWIRFTMIGISALIWIVTPIWFTWSVGRYSYNSYQTYKRSRLTDNLI